MTFYFRKKGQWPFEMAVDIKSPQHQLNFLSAMQRKGFIIVDRSEFEKTKVLREQFGTMYN
jgi:hypothetical protein